MIEKRSYSEGKSTKRGTDNRLMTLLAISVLLLSSLTLLLASTGNVLGSGAQATVTLNSPSDGATGVSPNPTLNVSVSDPEGDSMDVQFYNASDDVLIGENTSVSNGSYEQTWSGLSDGTTYNWYVNVSDGTATTHSSTWSFTTNTPPDEATNPSPSDGATGISTNPTLEVDVSDPDGDSMDVEFYNASDDSMLGESFDVSSGGTATYSWAFLNGGTSYSWYVITDDGNLTNQSSTWSFTTNNEPSASNPNPSDGSTIVQTTSELLEIDVSDGDGDTLNVTFFNSSDDSVIGFNSGVSSGSTTSVVYDGLSAGRTYSWYVTTDDDTDNITSDTWSFSVNNQASVSSPSPSDGATEVSMPVTLSVDVSDMDGDSMTVTFYNNSDDVQIGQNTGVTNGTTSVTWSGLSDNTTYSWYVTVDDGTDTITSSTWSFTTIEEWTLTINIDGEGSTTPSAGNYTYENGTEVMLYAAEDTGWKFVEWSGDIESTDDDVTIVMDENKTVTANFEEVEHSVSDSTNVLIDLFPLILIIMVVVMIGKVLGGFVEDIDCNE